MGDRSSKGLREDKISMLPEKMPKRNERRYTVMDGVGLAPEVVTFPKEKNGYTLTQVGLDVQCVV